MALSKKALQRKREKKKKKRFVKPSNSFETAVTYTNWPIFECWMPVELWEGGIGQVIVSRKNNQGDIAAGFYLVDTFCLGVKNCFLRHTTTFDYQEMLDHVRESCGEMKPIDQVYANTLIHKSIEYANRFGFKPHNDFLKAKQLLKNIEIDDSLSFSFGKDGKPYYVQGPNESHSDVKRILRALDLKVGRENYHFLSEVPEPYFLEQL